MVESTLATTASSERTKAGHSGKDLRAGLIDLPSLAAERLFPVARKIDHEALVVLLVDYYLRPKLLLGSSVSEEGLAVPGFEAPLEMPDTDRELIAEWLERPYRPHSPQAVYNVLGHLRGALICDLAELEVCAGPASPWREELRLGVGELRRLARARFFEACAGDEAKYHEMCHDSRASLQEHRLRLSAVSRPALAAALAPHADEVRMLMPAASKAALERFA